MTLQSTLQQLEIPSEFKDYDTVSESDVIVRLEQWRKQAIPILATLRDLTRQLEGELERSEQVHLTFVVSSFDGEGPWITKDAKQIAQGTYTLLKSSAELCLLIYPRYPELLDAFGDTDTSLSEQILNEHVKPIFRANPHPSVNATTGRKLPRALGGPLAQQDYYEGQFWKSHPGLPNTISWCIRHIKVTLVLRLSVPDADDVVGAGVRKDLAPHYTPHHDVTR